MLCRSEWPQDYAEQWWSAYPRKVSKKFALKCLARVRQSGEVPFEVLLSATKNYARSRIGKEMAYTKHPATWLNQGCWDDDSNALLDGRVPAPALPCANGGVLIRRGSPQAKAWAEYRGRDFPWGPSGVWMVESEWPEGQ